MSDLSSPVVEGAKKGLGDAGSFFLSFPSRVLNTLSGSPHHSEASSSSAAVVKKVAKAAVEDSAPSLGFLVILGLVILFFYICLCVAEEGRKEGRKEGSSPADPRNLGKKPGEDDAAAIGCAVIIFLLFVAGAIWFLLAKAAGFFKLLWEFKVPILIVLAGIAAIAAVASYFNKKEENFEAETSGSGENGNSGTATANGTQGKAAANEASGRARTDELASSKLYKECFAEFREVHERLGALKTFKKFLFGLRIPVAGASVEVRMLMLHESGLYVFWRRNFPEGKVVAKAAGDFWERLDATARGVSFENPVRKNAAQIAALRRFLGRELDEKFGTLPCFHSFFVIGGKCSLETDFGEGSAHKATMLPNLERTFKEAAVKTGKILTRREVFDIWWKLSRFSKPDVLVDDAGAEAAKEKAPKEEAKKQSEPQNSAKKREAPSEKPFKDVESQAEKSDDFWEDEKPAGEAEAWQNLIWPERTRFERSEFQKQTGLTYSQVFGDQSTKGKGRLGEYKMFDALRGVEGRHKFLCNALVKWEGSRGMQSTEIDLVMLHETGIYVFESKNWSGRVRLDKNGNALLNGNGSGNPLAQNSAHIGTLKKLLKRKFGREFGKSELYHSFIVFGSSGNLDVEGSESDSPLMRMLEFLRTGTYPSCEIERKGFMHRIVKLESLRKEFESFSKRREKILRGGQIKELYEELYPFTQVSEADREEHRLRMKRRKHGS